MRGRVEKKWDGSGGQDDQALGRSRGGFNGLGQPVELIVTPGQASGIGQTEGLLADHTPEVVIADRGYDKRALVEAVEERGGEEVIPTQKNRKGQRAVSPPVPRAVLGARQAVPPVGHPVREEGGHFLAFARVAAWMVMMK